QRLSRYMLKSGREQQPLNDHGYWRNFPGKCNVAILLRRSADAKPCRDLDPHHARGLMAETDGGRMLRPAWQGSPEAGIITIIC
ncbi:mCG144596, partial [Mus musculus]